MPSAPRIALPQPTSADLEYNRLCLPAYLVAIEQSGGTAVELPLLATEAELRHLIESCDGVLLPGSPADVSPERYGHTLHPATAAADPPREQLDRALLDDALAHHKPVLGICYGLQSANVWRGGTLVQDLNVFPVHHAAGAAVGIAHTALITADSALSNQLHPAEAPADGDHFRRLPINSSHHQAVGAPGDGLRVTARCPQDGVVEALESDPAAFDMALVAVQWHPERSFDTSASSRGLFRWLVEGATRHAQCRR